MEDRGHTEKETKPCTWARKGEAAVSMEIFSDKVNWKSNGLTLPWRQLESSSSQVVGVGGVGNVWRICFLGFEFVLPAFGGTSPGSEMKVTEQRRGSMRTSHTEGTAE